MDRKKILNYSHQSMLSALDAMRNGMPCATAAKKFGVPRVTLYYKFKGKYPEDRKMGPDTRLSPSEEEMLVVWLLTMAKKGFPITKDCFMASVARLVVELGKEEKFNNQPPGRKWYEGFLRRHPQISERMSQNLTKSRIEVTKAGVDEWFEEVKSYLIDQNQFDILESPRRVFNGDETAFFLNPKGSKVLARRGDKSIYQSGSNNEKFNLTVLFTVNAEGEVAPPMIVYKYSRIPSYLAESVPKDWGIGKSENGWMTCETFYEYMTNIFHPWLLKNKIELPVIFFVDGHISHMSIHLSNFCSSNGIVLIALLPNATHLLQPMDVAVFRTLKQGWSGAVHAWRISNQCEELKKVHFAPLLNDVIRGRVRPNIIENGFKKCGLVPWNSGAVAVNKPMSTNETEKVSTNQKELKKLEDNMKWMENYMTVHQLEEFQRNERSREWNGTIEHTTLFYMWSAIRRDIRKYKGENITSNDQIIEIIDQGDAFQLKTSVKGNSSNAKVNSNQIIDQHDENIDLSKNIHTNHKIDRAIACIASTPQKTISIPFGTTASTSTGGVLLPSPFKRSLYWPEEKTTKSKTRKTGDRVPSVVTSFQWQQYMKKKQEEKEAKEKAKEERKQKRQEKKREKEYLISLKKKNTGSKNKEMEVSDSETSENYSLQESDISIVDLEESTVLLPVDVKSLRKGDHIMVEFKGGKRGTTLFHYACIIQEIDNEEITVMALKCVDNDKKIFISKDEDVSTIQIGQILGMIPPPSLQVIGERIRYLFDQPLAVKEM